MEVGAVGAQVAPKKTGGGGKAVASAFIPGLGQFIDGRNKEGAGFFAGSVALGATSALLGSSLAKDSYKALENGKICRGAGSKAKIAGIALASIASFGLLIANIVDAYKGGKKA